MSEADENGVRALLADMAIGYRARDAERITGHYAPEIVMFGLAPPLRIRRGQLAEIGGRQADMTSADGVRAWLAGLGDAPFDYETREVEVVTGGDVGYAHCLVRMGSPGTFSMWFRMTHWGAPELPELADHPSAHLDTVLYGPDEGSGAGPGAMNGSRPSLR